MVGERSDVPAVDVGPARRECGKGLVNKRSEIPPSHHPPLAERFAPPPPEPVDPTPAEAMAHRLKTPDGKKLYALRKQTPEPVFGIIKSVLGFRQFLLRGLENVRNEWSLVTMAWNIKRIFALSPPN
jgi:hypothetical protein